MMKNLYFIPCILLSISIIGCSSTPQRATLRDLDKIDTENPQSPAYIKPKTQEEIKKAYEEYLTSAVASEDSRLDTINRLAEIEFEMSNRVLENDKPQQQESASDEELYGTILDNTISLLALSLRDYPNAKGNDKVLYQISKAHAQKGELEKSNTYLTQLINKYPNSPYYAEAQFRLGETAFARREYLTAENAYSEVIQSANSAQFYEKSLFKRGWARFKQQYYREAADDFVESMSQHNFGEISKLDKTEKENFDEYLRSISLAFSYQGGVKPLNDYFISRKDFPYIYQVYAAMSDLYIKQERYTDAANALEIFIAYHPQSDYLPYANLKTIEIWQQSGFENKTYAAIDTFYDSYNPDSNYWKNENNDSEINKSIRISMREYVRLIAEHFHSSYQKDKKASSFKSADSWYKRYLKHYQEYVRKDGMYLLYAELLELAKYNEKAINYYELAGYDGDTILSKKAAFATISLSSDLYEKSNRKESKWLDKHLKYSLLFSQTYPKDERTPKIITNAAGLAYGFKRYQQAIDLANLLSPDAPEDQYYKTHIVKANSYFSLDQYEQAEAAFTDLLETDSLPAIERDKIYDSLALAVYKQGETAQKSENPETAHYHFLRVSNIAPKSEVAATGLFDAIAISMQYEKWSDAISNSKKFQSLYPNHPQSADVTKKLSAAYLNSDQKLEAAKEFERISSFEENRDIKMAALWQAAELYESKNELPSAIRSYTEYANQYNDPYPQYIEAMQKLVDLNLQQKNYSDVTKWRNEIISASNKVSESKQTGRTKLLTSQATLALAKSKHSVFKNRKLAAPFQENLLRKKEAMQDAVKLYGQTSQFGIAETATEATHSIAEIYEEFSQSLLESERPKNLDVDQLEQYEILLEDQAFPFEEKAIEFFETNMAYTREGEYNDWIKKSYSRLQELFPVRYARKPQIDPYIEAE